jgi:undecaprenyl-diphosphatase
MLREFTNSLTRWDTLLFNRIFGWGDRRILSRSFRIISWSANGCFYPLLGFYVYLTFSSAVSKSFLLSAALAFPLERLLYHLLKQSMKRDRPCEGIVDVQFRVRPPDQFSFPSGHTASAFLMMTLLTNFFPVLRIPTLLWASTVGIARVYLGVHYPTDVLAGAILGIFTARVGIWFIV